MDFSCVVALPNKKKLRGFSLALPNINSGLGGNLGGSVYIYMHCILYIL